jgi:hypothetical protein
LIPVAKLHDDKPQGLFVTPEDRIFDLSENYLKDLAKLEGVSKEEFFKKALNNDEEFKYLESDDDTERNRKDTQKLVFSPDRFFATRMYQTDDLSILTSNEKLGQFIKSAVVGELPLYWESVKKPSQYYSQKVVGEDFERRVLDSKKDVLALIYHPVKEKNRKLLG